MRTSTKKISKKKDQRTPVNFRLPVGLYAWAKKSAKANGVTVTHLIEHGLGMLKELERAMRKESRLRAKEAKSTRGSYAKRKAKS